MPCDTTGRRLWTSSVYRLYRSNRPAKWPSSRGLSVIRDENRDVLVGLKCDSAGSTQEPVGIGGSQEPQAFVLTGDRCERFREIDVHGLTDTEHVPLIARWCSIRDRKRNGRRGGWWYRRRRRRGRRRGGRRCRRRRRRGGGRCRRVVVSRLSVDRHHRRMRTAQTPAKASLPRACSGATEAFVSEAVSPSDARDKCPIPRWPPLLLAARIEHLDPARVLASLVGGDSCPQSVANQRRLASMRLAVRGARAEMARPTSVVS